MENKTTFGYLLLFGALTGIAIIIFNLLIYLIGIEQKSYINLLRYIILIGGLIWGIANIRDMRLNGIISYGKAFGTGFWIGFFASILLAIYAYFYLTYLNPNILLDVVATAENKILESKPNISNADLDQALGIVKIFAKPGISAFTQFLMNLLFSTVFSLIIAIFAKREDRTIA